MLVGAARSRCAGVFVWMWAPPPFPHKGIEAQSVPAERSLPRWLYSRLRATTLARSGGGRWKVVVEVKWQCMCA